MSQSPFQKFVPKKKNSVIKEEFKQAKKKAKKERAAAIDKRFEEKRQVKAAARSGAVTGAASPATYWQNNPHGKADKIKAIETNFDQAQKIAGIKKAYEREPVKGTPGGGRPTSTVAVEMPLNKFLAHCGVCSRRDAVTLVKEGKVKVNNEIIKEPAHKVTDRMMFSSMANDYLSAKTWYIFY